MAIYHLHAGFVSRSTGRSAVQTAAYICGERLHEERRNKTVNFSKKSSEVLLAKTICPENIKYKDISVWNAIENYEDKYAEEYFKKEESLEKYKTCAQTAMTIVVALPNEFKKETNEELLDKFVKNRFVARGLVTTYAIHKKEGNMHAHLLISRRSIDEEGNFSKRKDRGICTRRAVVETRKLWASLTNEFLEREGIKERITEKSFASLGINLEPANHRGWYADHIGENSRIIQENLGITMRNEEILLNNPSVILDYLNEKKAVFTQKDILREISKRVFDDKKVSKVFEKVLEEAKYIGENIKGDFLYTGDKYEKLESSIISDFEELKEEKSIKICNLNTVHEVFEKYNYLNEEQKKAVENLIDNSNFRILIGKAGAGKTTAMQAVSEIYQKNGVRVIGMSLSAVAAENLGREAGIDSGTIASWSHQWRVYEQAQEKFLSFNSIVTEGVLKQLDWYKDLRRTEGAQLKRGDVIIVDEAGMVGAKEWKEIIEWAKKFGVKIIAIGDDNQFKPISAGDIFNQFIKISRESNKEGELAELKEIRRQKEDWQKEASIEFAQLNTVEALSKYENKGRLHELTDQREISKKFLEIERQGTAVVMCSTNKECKEINQNIRELKKTKKELGESLISLNGLELTKNEKIIFTENNKHFDIKNGQEGVVVSFKEGILSVETEEGRKEIEVSYYDKVAYGYAITLHKSQGKTYDNTILVANKILDAKGIYVGMTRHKENVDLYYRKEDFSTFKALTNSVSRYEYKDSIKDYRRIENTSKAQVIEYKELRMEMAEILKDIHNGEANWKEYNDLKKTSILLGQKILKMYESHRLYLDQEGITKERLEIQCGIKPRPLSRTEQQAKETVRLYVDTVVEVRDMYNSMKKDNFNIVNDSRYEEYCSIRKIRNNLAKEILSNYPLHREFINELGREAFITKKVIEKQIAYSEIRVGMEESSRTFAETLNKIERMEVPIKENKYKKYIEKTENFVQKQMEGRVYKLVLRMSEESSGHKEYVSRSMIKNYILENGLTVKTKDYMNKYASLLVEEKIKQGEIKEVTADGIISSIKEAVSFEVLRESISESKLTSEKIEELKRKAQLLSEKLTNKNVGVLNNKELMNQMAVSEGIKQDEAEKPIPQLEKTQLINMLSQELQKNENYIVNDIGASKDMGLSL